MRFKLNDNLRYSLYAVLAAGFLFFGVYSYATNLKEGIERKKEIQRLENEKLRLEIKSLKKEAMHISYVSESSLVFRIGDFGNAIEFDKYDDGEFKNLPIENKNTMILLAGKLILDFVGNER